MTSAQTTHDYYAILEVSSAASVDTIKKNYRRLLKERHPDKYPNVETATASFQLLQEAWDTIKDSVRRQDYDKILPDIRDRAQKQRENLRRQEEEKFQKGQNKGIWSPGATTAEHNWLDRAAAIRWYRENLNEDMKQPAKPRAEMVKKQEEAAAEGARFRADLLKEYKADQERKRREEEALQQRLLAAELKRKRAQARRAKLERELKEQAEQQRAADKAEAKTLADIQQLENLRDKCYRKLCVAKSAVDKAEAKLEEIEKLDDEDEDWLEKRSQSPWHFLSSSLSHSAREKHERKVRQREAALFKREAARDALEQWLDGGRAVLRKLETELRNLENDVAPFRPDVPPEMVWVWEYSSVSFLGGLKVREELVISVGNFKADSVMY